MRSPLTVATLLVGALTACSADSAMAPTLQPVVASAAVAGVSNPNTAVAARVSVHIDGSIVYRESGPGKNGKGSCVTGGAWYNPQNRTTSEKAHAQCAEVVAGRTIVVDFATTANYVLPPNGNVQLNVAADPACLATALDAAQCTRGIHYKKSQNVTGGFGLVTATEATSGTWTLDLAAAHQPFNASENNIVRTGMVVVACNATFGCHPGTMSW